MSHDQGIRSLAGQCGAIGWRLAVEAIGNADTRAPEDIVLASFIARGYHGTWCEGGAFRLLMKAASLSFLVRNNPFQDRQDALQRFFEAQCCILHLRRRELVATIARASTSAVQRAVRELCGHASTHQFFPTVTVDFLLDLWRVTGPALLARVADVFASNPFVYRSGWPDLTLVGPTGVEFVEVKTRDRLLESQIRFATELANPLSLTCLVVRLVSKAPPVVRPPADAQAPGATTNGDPLGEP